MRGHGESELPAGNMTASPEVGTMERLTSHHHTLADLVDPPKGRTQSQGMQFTGL